MVRVLYAILMSLFVAGQAHAYSYAAAGKEPLIDAREAIFKAVNAGDFEAAKQAASEISEELTYLTADYDHGLSGAFEKALASQDTATIAAAINRALVAEIARRLQAGAENLKDYQTAKVLVVKSKRFFDAMAGDLPGEQRQAADESLRKALEAIGNPGVFGVGKRDADPAAYSAAVEDVLKALAN
ncbi:hypothetical protein SAMN04488518_108282 [Pseudovibrio ascidiaceicola]|uniref:Uncharacterized protein n=1 Tax=Pseudovibrio ascidiaceicola TaxID=285279 RepID=A0A1I4C396_9HYPH|nr:hypothetical protein [Pseudovibrio ascidiaceicola]SFK74611.1 hypothetical protein SAMN04488518_108282 [Pseudovibrio ascidiaceicola]